MDRNGCTPSSTQTPANYRTGTDSTSMRPKTGRPHTATSNIGGYQQILCAVTESRGISTTVGLCFVNMTTGECVLSEICDSQTYVHTMHKLSVFDPTEILVPSTAMTPRKSNLLSIMEHYLPGARITQVPRGYYSEKSGYDYVQQLAFTDDIAGIKVAVSTKLYAMSAAAAALKYIELTYMRFALNSLRIKYQGSEGSMLIDFNTVYSLELIQNIQCANSSDCLFGLLNNTLTAMGARLLRSNILQPLTDVSTLILRLDALEEFTQHEEMFFQTRTALKPFLDMDRLLTALITIPVKASLKHSKQSINNIIILKQALACVPQVYESLSSARSELLVAIRSLCSISRIEPAKNLINRVINEDVTFSKSPLDLRNQRCYAVKSGVNGLLDVARQTYKEATEDVHSLVQELSQEHGLPLELKFETGRGYYMRLSASEIEERPLPDIFVNVVERKRTLELTTLELVKRNAKIADSLTEVLLMSDKTVQQLVEDVRKEISVLYKLCEGIAMLDMIVSFAHVCAIQDYVRPEFTDTLAIKAGRHPIREKIHKDRYVPNDVYASQQSRFQIITGCNMSGKSTYLRSVALMVVIAQIGSFVPAQYASFPITHQLFSRVSIDDGIEANVSAFASEMQETAFILRNVGKGSLIIMDELGRATSTRDGLALALAICEALIQSKALVWFATHFRDLAAILAERAGVVNLYMQTEMRGPHTMTMLYRVANGRVQDEHYGLALARVAGLPQGVLDKATLVSETLTRKLEERKRKSKAYHLSKRQNLVLRLKETLVQARDGQMEERALKSWLAKVQEEFVARLTKLSQVAEEDERNEIREDEEFEEYEGDTPPEDLDMEETETVETETEASETDDSNGE